jgi:hypothetical protein
MLRGLRALKEWWDLPNRPVDLGMPSFTLLSDAVPHLGELAIESCEPEDESKPDIDK